MTVLGPATRPPGRAGRDLGLDVVRAVALVSMYVAHFAPSDGPARVLSLSEYLTAPLFACLIGWGAQLEVERGRRGRSRAWSVAVRGAVLLALGLALERLSDQIIVILPWLGLLVWVAGVLVRLRSRWLVVIGLTLVALEPVLLERSREWLTTTVLLRQPSGVVTPRPDQLLAKLVELGSGGDAYRLTWLVPLACLGILLARHTGRDRLASGLGAAAAAGSLVLLVLGRADLVLLEPYSGRYAEMLLEALLVTAVVLLVRALAGRLPRVAALVAPAGAMTLSLYVVQVLVSQAWADAGRSGTTPGTLPGTDDSWLLLVLITLGSLLAALLWRTALDRSGLGRSVLGRGPLEGVVALLSRAVPAASGARRPS